MKQISVFLTSMFAILAFGACQDTHTEYESIPEEVYVGQLTDVELLPGFGRFVINGSSKYMKTASILRVEIVGREEYYDVPLDKSSNDFSYEVSGIAAGNYYIILTSFDPAGNKSVPKTYNVDVFDESSKSMFYPKRIISGEYDAEEGIMTLSWNAVAEAVEVTISYKDSDGHDVSVTLPGDVQTYVVRDWLDQSKVTVTTTILPVAGCVDNITLDATEFTFPKMEETPDEIINLPRSTFAMVSLESDVAQGKYGGPTSKLWDSNMFWSNAGYHSDDNCGVPHHITFDLGVKAKLTSVSIYFRQDGGWQDWPPRRLQIWAHPVVAEPGKTISDYDVFDAPDKDNAEFESESVAAGWLKLAEYYPVQEELETDCMVVVPLDDTYAVRYFRYRIVEGWKAPHTGPTMYGCATEMEFKAWKKSIKPVD